MESEWSILGNYRRWLWLRQLIHWFSRALIRVRLRAFSRVSPACTLEERTYTPSQLLQSTQLRIRQLSGQKKLIRWIWVLNSRRSSSRTLNKVMERILISNQLTKLTILHKQHLPSQRKIQLVTDTIFETKRRQVCKQGRIKTNTPK